MRKSWKRVAGAFVALLVLAPAVSEAGITYIDDGSSWTPNFNGWVSGRRTGFANNNDVYEGGNAGSTVAVTISGLTAGQTYKVYVYFWDASGNNWTIRAGIDSADTVVYTDSNCPQANSADFDNGPILVSEDNRTMYQAYLGNAAANGSGNIVVYVDPEGAGGSNTTRTWYDGVGYEAYDPLDVDAGGDYEIREEDGSIQFLGTATGGDPGYTYHWDIETVASFAGEDDQNPTLTWEYLTDTLGLDYGYYDVTLTVTDSESAQETDTATLHIKPPPAGTVFIVR